MAAAEAAADAMIDLETGGVGKAVGNRGAVSRGRK
jgi:hypothetical protein